MRDTILVTGAVGNVGSEVVKQLLARGTRVVAADRKPERVTSLFADNVIPARLDFRDASTWTPSLNGATSMFLVRPPAIADVQKNLIPYLDCARSNGVEHVVFLSVAGAERIRFVPHRKVEDHLRSTSVHFTNLRPGFFAQNLFSAYRLDIVQDDRIYVPAGHHAVNWIDVRDIAEVAAQVLTSPAAHRATSYTLAGPGPVPWREVTDALSTALGRPIRYEPASVLQYVMHLKRRGLLTGAIAVQTVLHFLLRFGQGATVDPALEQLLGRRPRTVREYINDCAHLWSKA
jgi:uncharacterized protein YbjT (DUF2867 family)